MFKDELKKRQSVVYRVLLNALKNNQLTHAYIFVGDQGSRTLETAYLLVQSLVCPNADGFADETCDTCIRIKDNNYADMIYLNGKEKTITKNDILNIKQEFSKTNTESVGKKVYIIDGAEFASDSAINSLLTFLEEPTSDAIAILLVENLENVLETIKSRCQIIKFNKINKDSCFNLISKDYDVLDAYLLSNIVLNIDECREVSESDSYQSARYAFTNFMDKYLDNDINYKLFLFNEVFIRSKKADNKVILNYLLEMIEIICKDALVGKQIDNIWYNSITNKINHEKAIHLIRVCNDIKDKNIKGSSINLLVDQFVFELEENNE